MSRNKKSRKPGSAPTAKPKLSKVELANVEKRVRKKTGKKPGNRQQEANQPQSTGQSVEQNKDPRIGSKKSIDLGSSVSSTPQKSAKQKTTETKIKQDSPIAAIRAVEVENTQTKQETKQTAEQYLAQELATIENDEQLQDILTKQETEQELTEQEVDYFNEMMDRHQALTEKLGITEEDDDEVASKRSDNSEDDLWDKLDSSYSPDDRA